MITVGILDNCPVVIRGVESILSNKPDLKFMGGYVSFKDFVREFSNEPIDVIVTDVSLKDSPSEQNITLLRKQFAQSRVVVFTLMDSIYYVKMAMRQGAAGYLLKTSEESDFIQAIRKVFAGEQYIEDGIKETIFQKALLNKKTVTEQPKLTRREKEILQLLASNFSSKEISKKLFISKKTVENHRSNMLLKFKVKNSASLIKKAIELDLIDE